MLLFFLKRMIKNENNKIRETSLLRYLIIIISKIQGNVYKESISHHQTLSESQKSIFPTSFQFHVNNYIFHFL